MDSLSESGAPLVLVDDVRPGDGSSAPTPEAERDDIPVHPSQMPNYVPGSGSTYAHDWSREGTGGRIERQGRHFVDAFGRVCSLRGVNVSGCSKIPANHSHDKFPADHHSVTFVGRPFPLEEAPQHFSRLRRWGLSFIRFLITWEAVEHAGPGIYDMEYLTYIKNLLSMLPEYGLSAFVVIHQDVWSRYSGGSGAPAWTLENVGFDLHALEESRAAWLLGVKGGGHVEAERGIWPCGYQKLAAATMMTCFWAGDTFAPKLKITAPNGDVKSVQQYLQDAFLDMYTLVAQTLGDVDGVLGFEVMNEPHRGYIDIPSLHKFDYNTDLHLSYVPSAFESFMLGSGYPTLVSHWTRSFPMPTRLTSRSVLNPDNRSAWRPDGPTQGKCIWEMQGVWAWDKVKNEGVILRENYFGKHPGTGRKIDWYTDFYYPFLKRWAERVHSVTPKWKMLFVEPIPNEFCPLSWTKDNQLPNMVFAPHWYDLDTLFSKSFGDFTVNVQGLSRGMFPLKTFYWGQKGARDNYSLQIQNTINAGCKVLGEVPVLIGECGIPMDMNEKNAFETENWTWQCRMMDAMMTGLERSLASFTLWNYNPDNTDAYGDDWNGENFSWFSRRRALPSSLLDLQQSSFTLDNGGRILPSVVRPYPAKTAGIPLKFEYEMNTGKFTFEWTTTTATQESTARETEIYVPSLIAYGRKLVVEGLAPEDQYIYDESRQTLFVVQGDSAPGKKKKIIVSVCPPLRPHFDVNAFWGDFGELIASGLVVFMGIFVFIKFRFYI
ncbi:glycoside hydrolase family 5 protein [Paxillus rubicundulus Ve08.2h10]|uniref:Unplaced genomic scaffold scaffold_55, whole genome shotgun sequence n=1 Tax=Paxillus rubicundulus Ve08.2h10 TaxID=930991 RepID=A0A0D0DK62_9AGAM|nr:glycoside hydrolase family 5 protein [Paxillus rubicundulus Ve08.2h10]